MEKNFPGCCDILNTNSSIHCGYIFLVGSDDGHEELLAAANAVINSGIIVFHISCSFYSEKLIL